MDENNQTPVTQMVDLEKLILAHTARIDTIADEIRKVNEMINDILENSPVYREQSAAAKEATRIKSATKQEVLRDPTASSTVSKLEDLRTQSKELKNALSNYLQQYMKISPTNQIEDEDGGVREIVYLAKLIKRSAKFRP